jgi:hypothetical protein
MPLMEQTGRITDVLINSKQDCKTVHLNTPRKVAGSRPDEVNFSIYLILPVALGPGIH